MQNRAHSRRRHRCTYFPCRFYNKTTRRLKRIFIYMSVRIHCNRVRFAKRPFTKMLINNNNYNIYGIILRGVKLRILKKETGKNHRGFAFGRGTSPPSLVWRFFLRVKAIIIPRYPYNNHYYTVIRTFDMLALQRAFVRIYKRRLRLSVPAARFLLRTSRAWWRVLYSIEYKGGEQQNR